MLLVPGYGNLLLSLFFIIYNLFDGMRDTCDVNPRNFLLFSKLLLTSAQL